MKASGCCYGDDIFGEFDSKIKTLTHTTADEKRTQYLLSFFPVSDYILMEEGNKREPKIQI